MFDGADLSPTLLYVGRAEFPHFAERLRPHFARMAAGSDGRYEAADIVGAVSLGHMQLWLAMEGPDILATMLTEVVTYPRLRALRCIGIVGHRPRVWMPLMADVERAARECFGCSRMEALVQPGHERLLRTGGWRQFHALWQKVIA